MRFIHHHISFVHIVDLDVCVRLYICEFDYFEFFSFFLLSIELHSRIGSLNNLEEHKEKYDSTANKTT